MSFFFGSDLWDEMSRMQRQLEDLSSEMDYKRSRIDCGKKQQQKGKQQCCCKSLSPFDKDEMSIFNPVTDLAENDHSYVVSMDLPGVKKEELNITVHNGVLTVSGTRHHKFEAHDDDGDDEKKEVKGDEEKKEKEVVEPAAEPSVKSTTPAEGEKKEEKKEVVKKEEKKEVAKKLTHKIIRMESFYGSFERSISVPVHTTAEDVHAKFDNGVLTITIDKPKKEEMKKIEIQ